MSAAWRLAAAAVLAVALVAVLTAIALEAREVAVLRTVDPDGGVRETRVWVADAEGAPWLEAATPERAWYLDVLHNPRIELVRQGRAQMLRAAPAPGEEGRLKIRSLLREKYGLADVWVGFFQDTSGSVAVRLVGEG